MNKEKLTILFGFISQWWQIIGSLLISVGALVYESAEFYYEYKVLPEVDTHITKVSHKTYEDSAGVYFAKYDTLKPTGLRTHFSQKTDVAKSNVADTLAVLYLREKEIREKLTKIIKYIDYSKGFNRWTITQTCDKEQIKGVNFWRSIHDDLYYEDESGFLWQAVYVNADDKYYYFPKYADGKRFECI